METVPDSILEEILLRVPAKTVLWCKTVSKSWLRMLNNPYFARIQFSSAPVCPLLVFRWRKPLRFSCRIMHLVEGHNVSDLDLRINKSNLITKICFNSLEARPSESVSNAWDTFSYRNLHAVSCEGLVSWVLHDHPDVDWIFICNPITGEYASLPPLPIEDSDYDYVFIGMGFCPSTKKYELLRMSAFDDGDDSDDDDGDVVLNWWPEVCTVGDRSWRRVGGGTFQAAALFRTVSQAVYVNGAIYWSYNGDSTLFCFDFDRNIFQVISLPQTNNIDSNNMSLGVLGNSLCVSLVSRSDGHVELWSVRNDSVSQVQWNKVLDIETRTTQLEHSGILWARGRYKALKYLDGGEILMHDWGGTLLIYDPITKEERYSVLDSCLEDLRKCGLDNLEVIPHVPCLVKMNEALNLDGVKVMFYI